MEVNSESIYGTTASPIGMPKWGRCTAKGDKLYLHVFDWPMDGTLEVPPAQANVQKAYLLADKKKTALPVEAVDKGLVITVGNNAPDAIDSVVVLVVDAQ
jgi:alpha-L-fucosidase